MFRSVMNLFGRLHADKRGVTAMEYGLIAATTAVAIVGALTTLGPRLTGVFTSISNALPQ